MLASPSRYPVTWAPILMCLQELKELIAQSFCSICHGAGRLLSRTQAIKKAKGRSIHRELEDKGIFVQSRGKRTIKEEMPEAYKDVSQVVDAVHGAGLACKVARLKLKISIFIYSGQDKSVKKHSIGKMRYNT